MLHFSNNQSLWCIPTFYASDSFSDIIISIVHIWPLFGQKVWQLCVQWHVILLNKQMITILVIYCFIVAVLIFMQSKLSNIFEQWWQGKSCPNHFMIIKQNQKLVKIPCKGKTWLHLVQKLTKEQYKSFDFHLMKGNLIVNWDSQSPV